MGNSAKGRLVYGYNLGGGDLDWAVEEANGKYGELNLDWYDEEEDEFLAAAECRLLASVGFTESWEDGCDGFHAREREAKERVGVEITQHCSSDFGGYILSAHTITASQGEVQTLDLAALQRLPADNRWDDHLSAALKALGLTPHQPQPTWLLCVYWG